MTSNTSYYEPEDPRSRLEVNTNPEMPIVGICGAKLPISHPVRSFLLRSRTSTESEVSVDSANDGAHNLDARCPLPKVRSSRGGELGSSRKILS